MRNQPVSVWLPLFFSRSVNPMARKMEDTTGRELLQRSVPRNLAEVEIVCSPYSSTGGMRTSGGVMRNFSTDGSYIETSQKFNSGTILIVRMVRYPSLPSSLTAEEGLRSICLAEVKWRQELEVATAIRYGMGLRYLH